MIPMTIPSSNASPTEPTPARRKTSFIGDVLKLVSGTIIAQMLGILASPILTRLYAPEAFGLLAIFTSITTLISVVACMRYELAIMLPESDEEAANLLAVSFFFALSVSLVTIPLLWFSRASLVALLNMPDLESYLWLIPPTIFISGAFLALNYWNSRTKHFGPLSIAKVSQALITVTTNLGLGISGITNGGALIVASVGGQTVATMILGGKTIKENLHWFTTSIRLSKMKKSVFRYRKFPLIDSWSAILNAFSIQLPSLLLAIFFSPTIVGFYAFGYRLLNLPMSLIGQSIAQVFFQRASVSKTDGTLAAVVQYTVQQLIHIAILPFLVLCIAAPELFDVLFGSRWIEAGLYVQILTPWLFFVFLGSPISTLINVIEIQEVNLLFNLTLIFSRLASLMIGGALQNIIIALSLFSLSGTILWIWFFIYVIKKSEVKIYVTVQMMLKHLLIGLLFTLPLILGKWMLGLNSLNIVIISVVSSITYYSFIVYQNRKLRWWIVQRVFKKSAR